MPRPHHALFALALLCGCPTPEYDYPPGAPEVARFEVVPHIIDAGEDVTVRWKTRDARAVRLVGVDGAPTEVAAEGETTFTPTASGELELVATGYGGERRARATFTVRSPNPVQVVSLTVEPRLVRPGEAVTVRWQTQDASRIRVRTSEGVSLYDGDLARGGATFRPERGVEVTLVAEGFMGPIASSVFVSTEEGLPFIHAFLADPPIASTRDTVRIAWLTSRATEVELFERIDDAWTSILAQPATNQTFWHPIQTNPGTRTFRLEARNATGAVASEATSVVLGTRQPTILTLTATPAVTGFGGTVRVEWSVVEARDVVLSTINLGAQDLPFVGARDVTVYSTGDITLVATDDFGASTSRSVRVTVDPTFPEIQQFAVLPDRVSLGSPVEIRVFVRGADAAAVRTEDGTEIPLPTIPTTWTPTETTVLSLVATSSFGATIARKRVAVNEAPVIEAFEIAARTVRRNRPTRLGWRTRDGIAARVRINGLPVAVEPDEGALRTTYSSAVETNLAFELTGASGQTVSSTATIDVLPAATGSGQEQEPNGSPATAHVLDALARPVVAGTLPAGLVGADDVDWYAIDVRPNQRLVATTAPTLEPCAGLLVTIFGQGPYGEAIGPYGTSSGLDCPELSAAAFPGLADAPEIVLVRFERPPGLDPGIEAPYQLDVTSEPRGCGDGILDDDETCDDGNVNSGDGCGNTCHLEGTDEIESNSNISRATPLIVGVPAFGHLAPRDPDVWQFDVAPGQEGPYRIDLTNGSGACGVDATVTLLDRTGRGLLEREPTSGCVTLDGPFTVLTAGTYFVVMVPGTGAQWPVRTEYRLAVTAGP